MTNAVSSTFGEKATLACSACEMVPRGQGTDLPRLSTAGTASPG